jgi:hypothetical protein
MPIDCLLGKRKNFERLTLDTQYDQIICGVNADRPRVPPKVLSSCDGCWPESIPGVDKGHVTILTRIR